MVSLFMNTFIASSSYPISPKRLSTFLGQIPAAAVSVKMKGKTYDHGNE
jgi:hypothetical protein